MGDGGALTLARRHPCALSGARRLQNLGLAVEVRLWAIGEAGAQRWNRWSTFYPLVIEIDPARRAA
jgi:hypothetical protein